MHYDIAIIGYGPSGEAAANLFGKKDIKILVVEPKKRNLGYSKSSSFRWSDTKSITLNGFIK
jgi:flavin-dependent dehydrogenase